MEVLAFGLALITGYLAILVVGRKFFSLRKVSALAEVSANIWITLGSMLLLLKIYQDRVTAQRDKQKISSDFQHAWNKSIIYMSTHQKEIPELVNAVYALPSRSEPDLSDPSTMLAVDYMTGQMWKSWMIEIELANSNELASWQGRKHPVHSFFSPGNSSKQDILIPEMLFIGGILQLPVFQEYRHINAAYYPPDFWKFADRATEYYKRWAKKHPSISGTMRG